MIKIFIYYTSYLNITNGFNSIKSDVKQLTTDLIKTKEKVKQLGKSVLEIADCIGDVIKTSEKVSDGITKVCDITEKYNKQTEDKLATLGKDIGSIVFQYLTVSIEKVKEINNENLYTINTIYNYMNQFPDLYEYKPSNIKDKKDTNTIVGWMELYQHYDNKKLKLGMV